MFKAYKYRIYPTEEQKVLIAKHFGCARWIYNYGLSNRITAFKEGKKITCIDISNTLPAIKNKEETSWLKEVNSQSLQSALRNLDSAYKKFFREKKGFPKFKNKFDNNQSFQCPQVCSVNFKINKLYIPKFREGIKTIFHRNFEGKVKTVTISKNCANKYFASILIDDGKPDIKPVEIKNSIGIDVGIKEFAVLSTGKKIANPCFLKRGLGKLKFLQKQFSKKQKGGKNREKLRLKVARLHERIGNRRKDFLHKVTKELINDNQIDTYCLETLNVKGMTANHRLARSVQDASWSGFVNFLTYKSNWIGKNILKIGRFEPSSKTCSNCGNIKDMPLEERMYECKCGYIEDRDVNAAKNIRQMALLANSSKDVACESVELPRVKNRKVKKLKRDVVTLQRDDEAEKSSREAGNHLINGEVPIVQGVVDCGFAYPEIRG